MVLSAGYAAYGLARDSSGGSLTAEKWNARIDAVNDSDSRISGLSTDMASF